MCREIFDSYVANLKTEQQFNKDSGKWELKNPWATKKDAQFFEDCYAVIKQSGLPFDGKHITLTQRGVTFDYVAYKNKMLQVYPDSEIDVELVYNGDSFAFEKENGHVTYKHVFNNPFNHKEQDIIGGYCIIKNKRGEFITLLSTEEMEKARKVAKTQSIWKAWLPEMYKKTVIKKAVKFHFDDIYTVLEDEDNKDYDLEKIDEPADKPELPEALKNAILEAPDYNALKAIYRREYNNLESASLKADFVQLSTMRKQELNNASL